MTRVASAQSAEKQALPEEEGRCGERMHKREQEESAGMGRAKMGASQEGRVALLGNSSSSEQPRSHLVQTQHCESSKPSWVWGGSGGDSGVTARGEGSGRSALGGLEDCV